MQKTLQSISSVSFMFFIVLGGLHLSTASLLAQNVVNPIDTIFFNVLDLPLVLSALLYGTSQLSLALENITGNIKIPVIALGTASMLIFVTTVYLNFGFPDANLF